MICTLSTIRFAVQLGIGRLGRAEHWRKVAVCPNHKLGASIVRRAGIGRLREIRIAGRQEVARLLTNMDRQEPQQSEFGLRDVGAAVSRTLSEFIVLDHDGQALAHVYYENEPGRRTAAILLARNEARWDKPEHRGTLSLPPWDRTKY
jgi:hypothetical protein